MANGNSSVEERLSEIMSYMTFDATGLTIGKDGSPVTVHIGNDRLSFKVNGGTVAYFSDNRLYVENGEFLGSLKLGKFAFVPQSNGNLS